ncbi:MAG: CHAD domain-containing protein [Desulfuromonadaceae bacterium]|nr:CHAD domain-containing protein [Desulfuromonadaceae bacterium]
MTRGSCHYLLPENHTPQDSFTLLEALGKVKTKAPEKSCRTYFDTFDWRLHRHGSSLMEERRSHQIRTWWRRLADNMTLGQISMSTPRFARDLPRGPLREKIASIIEMRALLPVASVDVVAYQGKLLNKNGKSVLRICVESAILNEGGRFSLPHRIRLEPLNGYRKHYDHARKLIEKTLSCQTAEAELEEALRCLGKKSQDYSGKLDLNLVASMASGSAIKLILEQLLTIMECNLDGARRGTDSEFLHDFRVALRRTRSLVNQIKGVLPDQVLERFRPEFKWLGEITGPTRDLDVYLLKWPTYQMSLPEPMRNDLEPLHGFLTLRQKKAQKVLARQLASKRCQRLLREWREFLEMPMESTIWPHKAEQSIGKIASRRIWKTCRQVWKKGAVIDDSSPPEALHELRIACKKLRYLMEFFQSLYPADVIRKLIKTLKEFQDNLGGFQDITIQTSALHQFRQEMQQERSDLPDSVFMAIEVLIDHVHCQQLAFRKKIGSLFTDFSALANRRTCRSLFRQKVFQKETAK